MPSADVSHARLLRAVQLPSFERGMIKSEDYSEFLICTLGQLGKERLSVCKETQLWQGRPLQKREIILAGFCSSLQTR